MGGKGDVEISGGGGAEPRDDYAPMNIVLDSDFPVFEDGAGEVEVMPFGNWVNAGGPPWYFEFVELTMTDYDYFGFSLYLFFQTLVGSIGALAVDGDYFLDFTNNRVYIYGYGGGAPTADSYCHMAPEQIEYSGTGPETLLDPPGPEQVWTVFPDLSDPDLDRLFGNTLFQEPGGRWWVYCKGSGSNPGRQGAYYSDDGISWTRTPGPYLNYVNPESYETQSNPAMMFQGTPATSGDSLFGNNSGGRYAGFIQGSRLALVERISWGHIWIFGGGSWGESVEVTHPWYEGSKPNKLYPNYQLRKDPALAAAAGHTIQAGQIDGFARDAFFTAPCSADPIDAVYPGICDLTEQLLRAQAYDSIIANIRTTSLSGFIHKHHFCKIPTSVPYHTTGPGPGVGASVTVKSSNYMSAGGGHIANHVCATYDHVSGKNYFHVFSSDTPNWQDDPSGGAKQNGSLYARSDNDGVTWSVNRWDQTYDPDYPSELMQNFKHVFTPDYRTLYLVTNHYWYADSLHQGGWELHFWRSLDHGTTWEKMTQGAQGVLLQSLYPDPVDDVYFAFLEYPDRIIMHYTCGFGGVLFRAYWLSEDQGYTWTLVKRINNANFGNRVWDWPDGPLGSPTRGYNQGVGGGHRQILPLNANEFMVLDSNYESQNLGSHNTLTKITVAPSDAVRFQICSSDAGFIIRDEHVNGLRRKLLHLNANVQTGGTDRVSFGIDVSDIPTVAAHKTPVRADHYSALKREHDAIAGQVATSPGSAYYTTGENLVDIMAEAETPVADGVTPVSIRTLIAMRKVIQALYADGWFCACYSYCPCQTHVDISIEGGKK